MLYLNCPRHSGVITEMLITNDLGQLIPAVKHSKSPIAVLLLVLVGFFFVFFLFTLHIITVLIISEAI